MHSTQWVSFITTVGIASWYGFASVTAFSCSFGREPNPKENGIIRWVMPLNHRLRCQCTSIYPGGMNTYTPERGFDPFYTDRPLFTDLDFEVFNYFECENCSLSCENGGTFIDDPCHCSCAKNWTGKTCTECALTGCENGAAIIDNTTCTCVCPVGKMGDTCAEPRYYDCQDYLQAHPYSENNVYTINPLKYPQGLDVYCDMKYWPGSIVIQKRRDIDLSFNRGWDEYRDGFGDLDSNSFWLGNEKVRQLTEDGAISWEIRVNVRNTLESYHAERRNYRLSGDNYTLHVDGSIDYMMNEESGVVLFANGKPFSTYDRDNDGDAGRNCAEESKGGWWFDGCGDGEINLNAKFTDDGVLSVSSISRIENTGLKIRRVTGD
ncbi:fibrinogen gamma chain-like [Asterias rubens]|uniref:fibrinogen gamma chain-like n=1 Tax=Asterias rubens TaxID=7604 RepID=UPI0014558E09|nr:fibrinogen gamma chain-like [Asterias rubens]